MTATDESADRRSLALIGLPRLMKLTEGRPEIKLGLIDGRVRLSHPELSAASIQYLSADQAPLANDAASLHATSVAGILVARRGSPAPAICPRASLVNRPIVFNHDSQSATSDDLASAIVETTAAGARILNLSLALSPSERGDARLHEALDYASSRNVIVVAAAGNQGEVGSSTVTRHATVVPVVSYTLDGRPAPASNVGSSIGRRGVGAAGEGLWSVGTDTGFVPFGGTSGAAACVSGAIALLWSTFPRASAADVMFAVSRSTARRVSIVPPLLNAWGAYEVLHAMS